MAKEYSTDWSQPEPGAVCEGVLALKRVYWALETEKDPTRREELRHQLGVCHEHLWPLMEPILMDVVRRQSRAWLQQEYQRVQRDGIQSVHENVAQGLYLNCIEKLLVTDIDPSKNIVSYIRQKALFILRDMHRAPQLTAPIDTLVEIDPKTSDLEEQAVRRFHQQVVWQAAHRFWDTLPEKTRDIMRLRYSTPPMKWSEVARRVGESDAYVRQLHKRALQKTIEYLKSIGLISP